MGCKKLTPDVCMKKMLTNCFLLFFFFFFCDPVLTCWPKFIQCWEEDIQQLSKSSLQQKLDDSIQTSQYILKRTITYFRFSQKLEKKNLIRRQKAFWVKQPRWTWQYSVQHYIKVHSRTPYRKETYDGVGLTFHRALLDSRHPIQAPPQQRCYF